mmetsp:Transcript_4169/g.8411  ORF Transcript_4169/g.8411 Transcript_4169/m.8411 type:complete len:277 (+) Transcript_4169:122-952(+)|eukprot:scaffold4286_cov92-Amphora_coffeaeformis.AAC.18
MSPKGKGNSKKKTANTSKKDPSSLNKPSRPLTAYNFFFHDERLKLQQRLFQANGQRPTYTQISRLVGASWKKISPDRKAHYDTLAMKDRRRYALELVAMKSLHHESEHHQPTDPHASSSLLPSLAPSSTAGAIGLEKKDSDAFLSFPTTLCSNVSFLSSTPGVVDPNSPSFQAMLLQTANNNPSTTTTLPLPTGEASAPSCPPDMTAQIALLSVMMIEYVRQVAPERIGGTNGPLMLPPSSTTIPTNEVATEPAQETGLFGDDDVQFLGETFGFDE